MMVMNGTWKGEGVFNVEQLDPEPFLKTLAKNGLTFKVVDYKPLPAKIG
jgi:saccharopine dehydrogenase (NAD+, L-lysine-forming)